MGRSRWGCGAAIAVFVASTGCGSDGTFEPGKRALGGAPCEGDPTFTCFPLTVPLDHALPDGPSIRVQLAMHAADNPSARIGALVTTYGGPGYSGAYYAEDFSEVDPRLRERFDLVFFDLRGVGLLPPETRGEPGLDCPNAANAFYSGGLRAGTSDEDAIVAARALAFGAACAHETGASETALPFYNSDQAASDLEAFRRVLGDEQLTFYGLSYGTQLAQVYATKYPEHVRAIAIDGVVDLSVPDVRFAADLARSTSRVLLRSFAACDADEACSADLPGGAKAAYDALASELEKAPALVPFPRTDGTIEARSFTLADLDTTASAAMEYEETRAGFLRALARAARTTNGARDLVPMLRVFAYAGGLDPDTLKIARDTAYSDAEYYTITCNDYGHGLGATPAEQQAAWLAAGEQLRLEPEQRLMSPFYGDLPCATWPFTPALAPPPLPFTPPAPLLFINADADTATPFDQGDGMFDRLAKAGADVRALHVAGGHHVMLGSGNACVDEATASFLLDPASVASASETPCEATLVAAYAPLSPVTAEELSDPLDVMWAITTEVTALPDFPALADGCDHGGTVASVGATNAVDLIGCKLFADLTVDGSATFDGERMHLEVTLAGAHFGRITFDDDGTTSHATGELDGAKVDATGAD